MVSQNKDIPLIKIEGIEDLTREINQLGRGGDYVIRLSIFKYQGPKK